ncbi:MULTISPECIES: alpha/beta fold hydrolase [Protofrankia]|uniref:Alpha/beta hydrolase n=1 Tax=Protofrankia coriariae TaxID=1562887 RepID=A0ABR5F7H3_9ACTN|nr:MULTISPECIES: alpha/beta hydrolase [Protofrankia]KLL12676.1 alpha/beta hydrolase [Protofrankia coriariae]ONH36169.1 alpha/beta hydrolase [Protofrankia sp. BMG5.30]
MRASLETDGVKAGGAGGAARATVAGRLLGIGGGVVRASRAITWTRAARAAGVTGLVTAAVIGTAAERRLARIRAERAGAAEEEPVDPVGGRPTTVITSDGVPLHVEIVGDADAPLTIVFVHGFCVSLDCWTFQRRDLADCGRLVFYDQRAHGASGPSELAGCTIDQLGDDLYRVLGEVVPTGPVVLVGHSMGGMTILALADAHPELFEDRIVGVALVSTSAGSLATVTFGLPATATLALRACLPGLAIGMRYAPSLLERGRRHSGDLAWVITRRVGFGSSEVEPAVVSLLEKMVTATPLHVVAAFLPALVSHDKLLAAAVLVTTPTLILVGDADVMTPLEHSRTLAAALPEADLVVVPNAGHSVLLERPDEVNAALRTLIQRARVRRPHPDNPIVPAPRDHGTDDIRA